MAGKTRTVSRNKTSPKRSLRCKEHHIYPQIGGMGWAEQNIREMMKDEGQVNESKAV